MFFESFSLESPARLLATLVPFVAAYGYYLYRNARTGAIPFTGLAYLRRRNLIAGSNRKLVRAALLVLMVAGLGVLWARPVYYSSYPLFGGLTNVTGKQFIVAMDISPSMNLTMQNPGIDRRGLRVNEEGVTKYEVARRSFFNFLDRFRGERFGLILFSTEPLLARWPTVETRHQFREILEESLRRGSASQIEAYSGLTNTDKALYLAKDVIDKTSSLQGRVVVLIADAWDDVEALSRAVKDLRGSGIRLYIVGIEVPEDVVEQLGEEFGDDTGFRIFDVDSEAEMAQAYYLIGEIEESPRLAAEGSLYETDLRWILSLILVIIAGLVIASMEISFHRSRSARAAVETR